MWIHIPDLYAIYRNELLISQYSYATSYISKLKSQHQAQRGITLLASRQRIQFVCTLFLKKKV